MVVSTLTSVTEELMEKYVSGELLSFLQRSRGVSNLGPPDVLFHIF